MRRGLVVVLALVSLVAAMVALGGGASVGAQSRQGQRSLAGAEDAVEYSFVTNAINSVTEYAKGASGNATPIATIQGTNTGLDVPVGVALDPSGHLYVANNHGNSVTEYARGATGNATPIATIKGALTGLAGPWGVAIDRTIDPNGQLVVANRDGDSVTVYARGRSGNVAPVRTVTGTNTGLAGPTGVTLDASGHLFVANRTVSSVTEYSSVASGNATPIATIQGSNTGLGGPTGLALDPSGRLAVTDDAPLYSAVTEYSAGASGNVAPIATILGLNTGLKDPFGVAIDASGSLVVANLEGNSVPEFASGASGNVAPIAIIQGTNTGLNSPAGVALAPTVPAVYTPMSPTRICDTRTNQPANQCTGSRLMTGGTLQVSLPSSVPAAATAAVVNITVTNTNGRGYLQVYPRGTPSPTQLTSVLNFTYGQTVANSLTARLGTNNAISIQNGPPSGTGGPVDVVVDLQGFYAPPSVSSPAGQYHPMTPGRIADTRCATSPQYCGGLPPANLGLHRFGPNSSEDVQINGVGGVPSSNVSAVVLNVGVTNTTGSSHFTAWPTGAIRPTASNQNWVAGETLSSKVISPVGSGGKVSLYNFAGSMDAVVDVDGYFSTSSGTAGDLYTTMNPVRVIGSNAGAVTVQPGASAVVTIASFSGYPAPADAAGGALNVTDVHPTKGNYLTVYPFGQTPPTATDVNWVPGNTYTVVPNASYGTVGDQGRIAVLNGPNNVSGNAGPTGVIADLFGYFVPGG